MCVCVCMLWWLTSVASVTLPLLSHTAPLVQLEKSNRAFDVILINGFGMERLVSKYTGWGSKLGDLKINCTELNWYKPCQSKGGEQLRQTCATHRINNSIV